MDKIPVQRLSPQAVLPTRVHDNDAGLDLYCLENQVIQPQSGALMRTGIAMALPERTVGLVTDRSSMAKRGLKTAGGVIDAGYRGEIHIVLWNISSAPIEICQGERIAQLLIIPISTPMPVEVQELNATLRGSKGFGSSGR